MMEMGALALGSGAVVGGVFGMNLVSGLEEHPQGEFKAMSADNFIHADSLENESTVWI